MECRCTRSAGLHPHSAVYFANKLKPPLLLSVGDKDGASDWHQISSYTISARRAGKTVVISGVRGENHSVGAEIESDRLPYAHQRVVRSLSEGERSKNWITPASPCLDREPRVKNAGGGAEIATAPAAGGGQN